MTLRKHSNSNILKSSPPKTEKFSDKTFSDKNSDIFHISAQNVDCLYSLEPPHRYLFFSRNKKNKVKSQFYNIKVGFKGGQNYIGMFS